MSLPSSCFWKSGLVRLALAINRPSIQRRKRNFMVHSLEVCQSAVHCSDLRQGLHPGVCYRFARERDEMSTNFGKSGTLRPRTEGCQLTASFRDLPGLNATVLLALIFTG